MPYFEFEFEHELDNGKSEFYTVSAAVDFGSPPNRQGHIDYWDDGDPGEIDEVLILDDKGREVSYDEFVTRTGWTLRKLQDWIWTKANRYNR